MSHDHRVYVSRLPTVSKLRKASLRVDHFLRLFVAEVGPTSASYGPTSRSRSSPEAKSGPDAGFPGARRADMRHRLPQPCSQYCARIGYSTVRRLSLGCYRVPQPLHFLGGMVFALFIEVSRFFFQRRAHV